MSDETYQGWKNYPTWAVNLWIGNERHLYERAQEITREEYDDARHCLQVRDGIWTVNEARRFNLADHFQEWICEEVALYEGADLLSDLITYALGEVDWHEIAENHLAEFGRNYVNA